MKKRPKLTPVVTKIDLGCGPNKKPGFYGLDRIKFDGVDCTCDLGRDRLPFPNDSIEEVHTSHFIEHLTATERIHVVNELYRVMQKDATCQVIIPHWASCRAYGDPTHQWPPISEFWFYYLSKEWRDKNAPHTDIKNWDKGLDCNFEVTWGYSLHSLLATRATDYQQHAVQFFKEAIEDISATLTKK